MICMGERCRIARRVEALVVEADQGSVAKAVLEDLAPIDEARIVGLGITPEQLALWKKGEFES